MSTSFEAFVAVHKRLKAAERALSRASSEFQQAQLSANDGQNKSSATSSDTSDDLLSELEETLDNAKLSEEKARDLFATLEERWTILYGPRNAQTRTPQELEELHRAAEPKRNCTPEEVYHHGFTCTEHCIQCRVNGMPECRLLPGVPYCAGCLDKGVACRFPSGFLLQGMRLKDVSVVHGTARETPPPKASKAPAKAPAAPPRRSIRKGAAVKATSKRVSQERNVQPDTAQRTDYTLAERDVATPHYRMVPPSSGSSSRPSSDNPAETPTLKFISDSGLTVVTARPPSPAPRRAPTWATLPNAKTTTVDSAVSTLADSTSSPRRNPPRSTRPTKYQLTTDLRYLQQQSLVANESKLVGGEGGVAEVAASTKEDMSAERLRESSSSSSLSSIVSESSLRHLGGAQTSHGSKVPPTVIDLRSPSPPAQPSLAPPPVSASAAPSPAVVSTQGESPLAQLAHAASLMEAAPPVSRHKSPVQGMNNAADLLPGPSSTPGLREPQFYPLLTPLPRPANEPLNRPRQKRPWFFPSPPPEAAPVHHRPRLLGGHGRDRDQHQSDWSLGPQPSFMQLKAACSFEPYQFNNSPRRSTPAVSATAAQYQETASANKRLRSSTPSAAPGLPMTSPEASQPLRSPAAEALRQCESLFQRIVILCSTLRRGEKDKLLMLDQFNDGFQTAVKNGNAWQMQAIFYQVSGMVLTAKPTKTQQKEAEERSEEFDRALKLYRGS